MAYDNTGAAVGAAGHYAAALTAAFITSGAVTTREDALDMFGDILTATFAACEGLKGEQPVTEAPARASRGGGRSYGGSRGGSRSGGGNTQDPGTVDFRGGKYAGKTIADVYGDDPDYLDWCVQNLKNDFMVGRIEAFLATAA